MLLKSFAAGVLALGLLGTVAFNSTASDLAPTAAVQMQGVESNDLAAPTCCAKHAYCCSQKQSCCGKSTMVSSDD